MLSYLATPTKSLILCILLVLSLTGCVTSILTGAQLVYDRNELKRGISSHRLNAHANHVVFDNYPHLKREHVNITVFNRDVLVTGQVKNKRDKQLVHQLLKPLKGRREFYNELVIGPRVSFGQGVKDAWITSKIRAKMVAENGIEPSKFKIITENGVVYVLGDVPKEQGRIVVHLARNTNGVKQVVRVMKYLTYAQKQKRKQTQNA